MRTAFKSLTVSNTAIGITPPTGMSYAYITVDDDSIRYRIDGGDPTTVLGHLALSGDVIELQNADEIRNFRAIRVSNDAILQVTLKEINDVGTRP